MMKFLFKTALVGAVAAGAAVAFVGPHKVQDWVHSSKRAVEEQISEFQGMSAELHKIESRVDSLNREIDELKETVLKEEYEVKSLEQEVGNREQSLEFLRQNLEKANALLNSELDQFSIRGITYTKTEIEQDVAEKMRLFKVQEETLAQLREVRETREYALAMARDNVTRGETVREEMMGRVRLMEAKLERYKAREIYAEAIAMDFDAREFNTEMGDTRQSLAKFEKKLDIKNRLLDDRMRVSQAEQNVVSGIDYTQTAKVEGTVCDQLSEFLAHRTDAVEADAEMVAAKN